MTGPGRLLSGATVLTCDPDVPDLLTGDVLIQDARIAAVGPSLPCPEGTERVDVTGAIVFPGLVDSHQHVWEGPHFLRAPDTGVGEYFSEFIPQAAGAVTPDGLYESSRQLYRSCLKSGTTTILDWCHVTNSPAHADAALSAMQDSGIRGHFAYGPPVALGYYGSDRDHPADLERFVNAHAPSASDRIGLVAALRGPDLSPLHVTGRDLARARALRLPVSMHIGTRRFGPGGVTALAHADLLGPDLQFVHTTDCTDLEFDLIQDAGARIVVPPAAELTMGVGDPPLTRLAARGQQFALAVDTAIGGPQDMFGQMRAALLLLRQGQWEGTRPPPQSSCADVLAAATLSGAQACWLEDDIGSLTPGKLADMVLFRPTRPVQSLAEAYAQVVWTGDASRVESVLVAGQEQR